MSRAIRGWDTVHVAANPKVSLVVAAYQYPDGLACLLYSLRCQTYSNWEAIIMHDGPSEEVRRVVAAIGDPRVRLVETEERKGSFGHPWRKTGIDMTTGDYIGLSNDDNYYAPVYFEWMLHDLITANADVAHCNMIHSHQRWAAFRTSPRVGGIDAGSWVAKAHVARQTPWDEMGLCGDGVFFEAMAKGRKVVSVDGYLFVHN